jgi:hypothetical protein
MIKKQRDLVSLLQFAELDRIYVKRHVEKYLERFFQRFTAIKHDMLVYIDADEDEQEDIICILSPSENDTAVEDDCHRREARRARKLSLYTRCFSKNIEDCLNASKFQTSDIHGGYFGQYLAFFGRLTRKIEENQKMMAHRQQDRYPKISISS